VKTKEQIVIPIMVYFLNIQIKFIEYIDYGKL